MREPTKCSSDVAACAACNFPTYLMQVRTNRTSGPNELMVAVEACISLHNGAHHGRVVRSVWVQGVFLNSGPFPNDVLGVLLLEL